MSIQSEITRIAGAKSNIADAIEAKGVTVPSSTKIDGYAPLIAQIPTGNVVITETPDPAGGTVLEVTGGIDLSNDTVAADKLLYGYTAHDSTGTAITGSLASGSATTPTTTITANPTISVNSSTGEITATASASESVTPTVSPGVVSSGTAGTITVSGSSTSQLTTQAAATITPTTSSQTAVAAGVYTTGAVTVGAIPSEYADVSSTTAVAEDVATGKVFVSANGTITIGTATGGTEMTVLSYGNSTWQDFLDAYSTNTIVYCRASSNSNPASGSQTRMAFMAYVNNATNPTNVEFQYYRSVNQHSATQQGDQVYVYKLDKTAGWTVTVRESYTKIVAGTGLTSSYSNGVLTISLA